MTKRCLAGGSTALLVFLASTLLGCGKSPEGGEASTNTSAGNVALSGAINADGSSTVYPIMERMVEFFGKLHPDVRPVVSTSGTGGGFKKFVSGEIDIANASRPIEPEEVAKAKENGVEFVEVPIAFDGLSVVVNPQNDWAKTLTVAELKKIWEPGSKVALWSDVRAGFPSEKITLFGAGTDSGTFDYFTKAINGKEKESRSDYMASEDDNVLVSGVAGDKFALGYFGYAYYEKNTDKMRAVAIDGGAGPVAPSPETISNNTYTPLSRPLLIYVNRKALDRPEIMEFVKYLLTEGRGAIREVGYVPLPDEAYDLALKRVEAKTTGTVFQGAEVGVGIQDVLKREAAK